MLLVNDLGYEVRLEVALETVSGEAIFIYLIICML